MVVQSRPLSLKCCRPNCRSRFFFWAGWVEKTQNLVDQHLFVFVMRYTYPELDHMWKYCILNVPIQRDTVTWIQAKLLMSLCCFCRTNSPVWTSVSELMEVDMWRRSTPSASPFQRLWLPFIRNVREMIWLEFIVGAFVKQMFCGFYAKD